jgi:hypothetical protein
MLSVALMLHLLAATPEPAQSVTPGTASAAPQPGTPQLSAMPRLGIPGGPGGVEPRGRRPFGGAVLAAASLGALAGDALVVGLGYGALQLFANGTIEPNAENFRRAAFLLAGTALVLPPLLAVLGARWAGGRGGSLWRGLLLATTGQVAALLAGYWASPHLWAFVPAQLAALSSGASLGLHWGRGGRRGDPHGERGLDARGALRERSMGETGQAGETRKTAEPALALLHGCPVDG